MNNIKIAYIGKATSLDEQISLLKQAGILIKDEALARNHFSLALLHRSAGTSLRGRFSGRSNPSIILHSYSFITSHGYRYEKMSCHLYNGEQEIWHAVHRRD